MRIYIQGDVADTMTLHVVDASNDQDISHTLVGIDLTITAGAYTKATLRFNDGSTGGATVVCSPARRKAETAAPPVRRAACLECRGTGEWENPLTGKRSPCKQGCKKP